MSLLAIYILYSSKNETLYNPNYIVLFVGVLYIVFGNYFKTIKANYFFGIRTPWTLESETVWKKTHELGGKLWFVGGIIVVLASLILEQQYNFTVFVVITIIIALVPIVYSYILFRKEKKWFGIDN
ncbi:SdpI family protein [Gelidibacter mesophilus]|uniref:SdpI family protein n=1 Tax=Gelidibacter mesophilus TaxID=169050 RepID=UPI00316AE8ED